jgi:hypothetical protein
VHSSSSQSECVSPYREGVINRTIIGPAPAQEWEQWLRSRLIFVVRDRAEFLAVFTLSTGSLALSFYRMFTSGLRVELPASFSSHWESLLQSYGR